MNATARSTRLNHLTPGSKYTICVLALGNLDKSSLTAAATLPDARVAAPIHENNTTQLYGDEHIFNHIRPYMNDSLTTKCTAVSTIEMYGSAIDSPFSNTYMGIADILTRRLSLVVGCCMGFIVFVVLVSGLGYIKSKKRTVLTKPESQEVPQYISYDHFPVQSMENIQSSNAEITTISDKTKPQ